MLTPCEVEQPDTYPLLGLALAPCDTRSLQWVRDCKAFSMTPLADAAKLLPFLVAKIEESDPLGEGAVSEIALVGSDGSRVVFRHIMPPMTLGSELQQHGQAPNNSFKPNLLRKSA